MKGVSGVKRSQSSYLKLLLQYLSYGHEIESKWVGHDHSQCDSIQEVTKKITFKFTFLVVSSLIVNVPFRHENGAGELCKLEILIVVS